MKKTLRNLCWPILSRFESGEGKYKYKKSHRTILVVLGLLFLALSIVGFVVTFSVGQYGGLFPAVIFLVVALTCVVIGALGTDRAVSNMWRIK